MNEKIATIRSLVAAALTLLLILPVQATTIERIGFNEVVERSELIVEGTVLSVHSEQDTQGRYIWTHVRVRVNDTIKGSSNDEEIVLKFIGGAVNDLTLKVPDMNYPQVGDTGMYFLTCAI